MSGGPDSELGEFIRRQREVQSLSMRKLAELAGISNPYLSQIERGLRDPSAKVLDSIARNLEVSSETLERYSEPVHRSAGEDEYPVVAAIHPDPALSRRQRPALLEIYESFTQTRRRP